MEVFKGKKKLPHKLELTNINGFGTYPYGQDEIFVEVSAASAKSWYRAQDILSELPVVTSLSVYSLTAEKGVLKVRLSGPVESLKMAIRASGYRLDVGERNYQLHINPNEVR